MNVLEVKLLRIRRGMKQSDMAAALGISTKKYSDKERGVTRFTDEEKVVAAKVLGMTWEQMNDFFYDGVLPIGNFKGADNQYVR